VEKTLLEAGKTNFEFFIVGEGTEREWLSQNMKTATFTGFLSGEELAEAYANMDIFVFPSATDAFGNVVQEANASGVPAIVSDKGGPKFITKHGETGFIVENLDDFAKYSLELLDNPEKLSKMKKVAREFALERSWDSVFEKVYQAYEETIKIAEERKNASKAAKTARV
jgi:glycosyltransferase involved in cell wall biosynthesis